MAKKKLKHKKKTKAKKSSFLNCCNCISKNDDSDDTTNIPRTSKTTTQLQSTSNMLAAKHEMSVTYRTSSIFVIEPEMGIPNNNLLLSQAYLEKMQNDAKVPPPANPALEDREKKDQLVKTILSKYLQTKREEMLNRPEPKNDEHNCFSKTLPSPKNSQDNDIKVEYSSDTLILDPEMDNEERPKAEFPTKSRSAPTTSTAHDSLADICSKMGRYKQDIKSDSYVSCSSDENATPKKKLELIFNRSSDEICSPYEGSTFCIGYSISCEGTPVTTGTLIPDEKVVSFTS